MHFEKVETYDDFIEAIAQTLDGRIKLSDIEFSENFTCKIEIVGEKWEGYIDYTISKFIIDSQYSLKKACYNTLKDIDIQKAKTYSNLVEIKGRVTKGSTLLDLCVNYFLSSALKEMTGTQITLSYIFTIASTVGLWLGKRVIDTKKELESKSIEESTKQKIAEAYNETVKSIVDIERPYRNLVSRLSEQDALYFPQTDKKYSKDQIPSDLLTEEHPRSKTYYIDDLYHIDTVSFRRSTASCRKGASHYVASIKSLSEKDRQYFYDQIKEAGEVSHVPSLHLQVNLLLEIDDYSAMIIGFGEKREGSVPFSEAKQDFYGRDHGPRHKQASLLDYID